MGWWSFGMGAVVGIGLWNVLYWWWWCGPPVPLLSAADRDRLRILSRCLTSYPHSKEEVEGWTQEVLAIVERICTRL